MRIALAILLNAALLAMLLPWLRRQWHWATANGWRWIFTVGLGLRVGVGLWRGLTLKFDAAYMTQVGNTVTRLLWDGELYILVQSITTFPDGHGAMIYQSTSNTWMLIKVLALLNFLSVSQGWLNALYLSLFAFIGCWVLSRILAERFLPTGAGVVAFLLWPSVWFWATGISKEAALLGSGAWLTARVVERLYPIPNCGEAKSTSLFWWWLGTLALAYLHFHMRYFFATPLLVVLCSIAFSHWLRRYRLTRPYRVQVIALATALGAIAWLAPQVSVAFRMNKFTSQVVRVYAFEVSHTIGRPHLEYPNLHPTIESIAAHAPLAVVNALTRPWLGETKQTFYLAAGLENAALLILFALFGLAAMHGCIGKLPVGLSIGLGLFCLMVAFLIGLTTPNLGSLSRYRSELLPFLLLLLLQNNYAVKLLKYLRLNRVNMNRLR
ncbi:hypothetical protein MON38_00200 [Hymenobacter sp. DH14]|uniref:Uncharacterized protein n=1 Tax=Hymenobacter cyanobacteriorum TaxID=2926463 RepID=A0A9X1VCY6_9BACT|nr:hypothetical protein [Hymenobacter cyanobacteriorum]MCI1185823.1 hypothetical protein [Hymenobacter cyanobacteriorum]